MNTHGNVLIEKTAQTGQTRHQFDVQAFPTGAYWCYAVTEGRLQWKTTFIKTGE